MCLPCATCQGSEVDRPHPRGHRAWLCSPQGGISLCGPRGKGLTWHQVYFTGQHPGDRVWAARAAVSEAPGAQAKRLTPQIVRPVTTPCTRHSTCSTATPTGTSGPSGSSNTWCGRPTSASPGDCGEATWFLECRSQPLQSGTRRARGRLGASDHVRGRGHGQLPWATLL